MTRENLCHFVREAGLTDVRTDCSAPPSGRAEARGSPDGVCQRAAGQGREGAACCGEERRFTAGELAGETVARIESGAHEVELQIERGGIRSTAQIQWMPEPDWFVVELENKTNVQQGQDPATQLTIQELLQERE